MLDLEANEGMTVFELDAFKKRAALVRKKLGLTASAFLDWAANIVERPISRMSYLRKSDWEQILPLMESKDAPPDTFTALPSSFQFSVADWMAAATLSPNYVPPSDAVLELVVDPSYVAKPGNDCTGLAVGFKADDPEIDERVVTLLHCEAGRWKGIALAKTIADTAEAWHVGKIKIEYTSNGACDLLTDNIKQLTNVPIETFEPSKGYQAKGRRIMSLQTLLSHDPPLIRFCREALFVPTLLEQVRTFLFEKYKKRDRARLDDCLDAIALLAGFH